MSLYGRDTRRSNHIPAPFEIIHRLHKKDSKAKSCRNLKIEIGGYTAPRNFKWPASPATQHRQPRSTKSKQDQGLHEEERIEQIKNKIKSRLNNWLKKKKPIDRTQTEQVEDPSEPARSSEVVRVLQLQYLQKNYIQYMNKNTKHMKTEESCTKTPTRGLTMLRTESNDWLKKQLPQKKVMALMKMQSRKTPKRFTAVGNDVQTPKSSQAVMLNLKAYLCRRLEAGMTTTKVSSYLLRESPEARQPIERFERYSAKPTFYRQKKDLKTLQPTYRQMMTVEEIRPWEQPAEQTLNI